ncbi:MAG: hypothetical protein IH936_07780 [Acidobacteria bacterium]|nr:hypothetical protein [Acidobacteriota bacterium]
MLGNFLESPTGSALFRPPTLHEAVAALPLSGSGELTREMLAPLAETGEAAAVVLRCADELDWLPGLVEVVRTACQAQSKDPFQRRGDGIDTLCDHLAHHIDRIVLVLRGAYAELEPSTQAQHP